MSDWTQNWLSARETCLLVWSSAKRGAWCNKGITVLGLFSKGVTSEGESCEIVTFACSRVYDNIPEIVPKPGDGGLLSPRGAFMDVAFPAYSRHEQVVNPPRSGIAEFFQELNKCFNP